MKLAQIFETVAQQHTVTNPADIKQNKYYIHTVNDDQEESVVWGPFEQDEAKGFLQHSGFDYNNDISAKIMKGSDVIKTGALKESMKDMMLKAMDPDRFKKYSSEQDREEQRKKSKGTKKARKKVGVR